MLLVGLPKVDEQVHFKLYTHAFLKLCGRKDYAQQLSYSGVQIEKWFAHQHQCLCARTQTLTGLLRDALPTYTPSCATGPKHQAPEGFQKLLVEVFDGAMAGC